MDGVSLITVQDLIAKAKLAASQAYAPYSKFRVGAAILTDKGDIFTGCNVENASYGLTNCAERVAIGNMVANGRWDSKISKIVVYTPTQQATAPCGACRQVIFEFALESTQIISTCESGEGFYLKVQEMLPYAFGPKSLL